MMKGYEACDNPEHDGFAHRKIDCGECIQGSPPNDSIRWEEAMQIANGVIENKTQNYVSAARILAQFIIAQSNAGLIIKGWFCACHIFNGEEKEIRTECRSCGLPKTVRI